MRTEKFDGKIKSWWGNALTSLRLKDGTLNTVKTLKFDGSFEAFGPDKEVASYTKEDWESALEEIRAAKVEPTTEEIVTLRNDKLRGKARQAAQAAVIATTGLVQPTLENDDQLKLKKMYDVYIVMKNKATGEKFTEEEARAKAVEEVGVDWVN